MTILFAVAVLVSGIITFVVQNSISDSAIRKQTESRASEIGGETAAANAGHEYPVMQKAPSGPLELVKDKHGFVIGGMPGMKYKEYELQMTPGTKLFLYTDGVPEATDENGEMFGVGRMIAALNEDPDAAPEHVLQNVRRAVDGFVKDTEQFDDLTMLCLEYKGKPSEQTADYHK